MNAPSLPKGMRDFPPEVLARRNYIFDVLKKVFARYGYPQLETPAMEQLETLTGKYGDEGDQLLFRVLNSRQHEAKNKDEILAAFRQTLEKNTNSSLLTERALRYDLTVPFARFVVMNHGHLVFPFKRSQIQPVWRADRPQKGRYREFYQCDVDVVGSPSLVYEVEMIQVLDAALAELGIDAVIKINNRKMLAGLAEVTGAGDRMIELTVALDKLDKTGADGVIAALTADGFSAATIEALRPLLSLEGNTAEKLNVMEKLLDGNAFGQKGLEEIRFVLDRAAKGLKGTTLEFDLTLARGLNYYTGAIFEVTARHVQMGSICGGGRYDNLTGIFGLPGVSGIGVSFGADRIYDVMNELNLFPPQAGGAVSLLLAHLGEEERDRCLEVAQELRAAGIATEVYPDVTKIKKQFKFADDKNIRFVGVIGPDELKQGTISLKNLVSGEQQALTVQEVAAALMR